MTLFNIYKKKISPVNYIWSFCASGRTFPYMAKVRKRIPIIKINKWEYVFNWWNCNCYFLQYQQFYSVTSHVEWRWKSQKDDRQIDFLPSFLCVWCCVHTDNDSYYILYWLINWTTYLFLNINDAPETDDNFFCRFCNKMNWKWFLRNWSWNVNVKN